MIYCIYDRRRHLIIWMVTFDHREVDPSQFLFPICGVEVRISVSHISSPREASVDQITVLKSEGRSIGPIRNTMGFSEQIES